VPPGSSRDARSDREQEESQARHANHLRTQSHKGTAFAAAWPHLAIGRTRCGLTAKPVSGAIQQRRLSGCPSASRAVLLPGALAIAYASSQPLFWGADRVLRPALARCRALAAVFCVSKTPQSPLLRIVSKATSDINRVAIAVRSFEDRQSGNGLQGSSLTLQTVPSSCTDEPARLFLLLQALPSTL